MGVVMTLHVLHGGDGYSYLTRQVATADRLRERGQELTDYYTANGTPPGRWHGAGLEALSEISPVSGTVSEEQMKALFGEGRHPNTDQMLEAGADLKATALGRKFPEFKNEIPLVEEYKSTLRELAEEGHTIDKATTSDLWRTLADKHYRAKFGHQPPTERELLSWAAAQRSNVRQPVAGMDLVFTPQKSVSTLWALADTDTRREIERIHRECVNDSLAWIEREAAFTRRGDRSERQIDTHGLIVAQFDHYDTRAGDPNLHTHCAVSNKVLGVDGKWSALDGAALHKHAVAASQRYNAAIVDRLRREMGVAFEARYPTRDRQPVWEVAGIDQTLCRAFSSRRQMVEARRDELLAEYRATHGRAPTQAVQYALLQQATLDTREGKQESRSLADHQSTWRRLAARHLGSEAAVDAMVSRALNPETPDSQAREMNPSVRQMEAVEVESARVIEAVSDARATWTHAHVRAVVETQLTNVAFTSPTERDHAVTTVVDHALGRGSVALSTPETLEAPTALRRDSDGLGVLERHGELLHTSTAMLDAEGQVVAAAQTPVPVFTTGEQLRAVIAEQESASGRVLNPGQRALAEHFCLSGQLVAAGVGPAGTGKTTSMKAVTAAWQASGRQVIALAPSAVAADTLGEEIGAEARTLASLTYRWRGKMEYMGFAARSPEELPVTIEPGAMLLLDEAAMASTKDVAALVEIARDRGAVVRMVGDPAQLDAVESGGLMRLVASETNAPELTDVVRFGDDTAQARASIAIRSGDQDALQFHADNGWVHGGAREEMIAAAVADHFADTDAGSDGIVLASTTATVRVLNTQIQNRHRDTGAAQARRLVDLADDLTAGRGDIVVTRANNGGLRTKGGTRPGSRVQNGDRWRVEKVGADGSLTVRHLRHRGRVTLDADYVAGCTELGYASTIHRAQGITVDVSRTVVDEATNRRGLYVALSRGRAENHAYAVTDSPLDVETEKPHLPPGVDARLTTARGVLAAALARDDGHTTATEQLRDALAAAEDPDRMAAGYAAARDLLVRDYTTHLAGAMTVGEVPEAETAPLRVAVDKALARGVDVAAAIAQWHHEVDSPDDPLASATGWLSGYEVDTDTDLGHLAPLPSRHPGMDTELADYAAATLAEHTRLTHAPIEETPEQDDEDLDPFAASYLAHRAADRANGPAVGKTTGPSVNWGPATGPDSSADL
ncbi:TraA [Hoyosella subflava DQS3-9A1]|uniref:TraA n=2 Tax=Hoyosella TaxID=697025 RepID=F6EL39_HOYSD|nr:TraA [Hoyosella subflava DQS3-9A1]